jgi:hypothetical protein
MDEPINFVVFDDTEFYINIVDWEEWHENIVPLVYVVN